MQIHNRLNLNRRVCNPVAQITGGYPAGPPQFHAGIKSLDGNATPSLSVDVHIHTGALGVGLGVNVGVREGRLVSVGGGGISVVVGGATVELAKGGSVGRSVALRDEVGLSGSSALQPAVRRTNKSVKE